MNKSTILSDYMPAGDIVVVSICMVMMVLLFFSYTRITKSLKLFMTTVGLLALSALSNVAYHMIAATMPNSLGLAYAIRCAHHALLYSVFLLFVFYICEAARLEKAQRKPFIVAATLLLLIVVVLDIASSIQSVTSSAGQSLRLLRRETVFMAGYIAYVALIAVLLSKVRDRLFKRVMLGFYGAMAISFLILLVQRLHGQSSFTVATFLYPVIAILFLLHSNPYDVTLGSVDSRALEDMVRYNLDRHQDFMFMSLYLRSFDEEGKQFPENVQALIRKFSSEYFRGGMLYQAGHGHMILVFNERRNPNYKSRIDHVMEEFYKHYEQLGYDYMIVMGRSVEAISRRNEYVSFISSIHQRMEQNTVHWVDDSDIKRFSQTDYILQELADIYAQHDLDDPRVLAYCQPVLNISTRKYDTAEALMRLNLKDIGLVFPDHFIPLAEKHGYIHVLTEIILHKTCESIRKLLEAGYNLRRISVNVSVMELKDADFCEDVTRIIDMSGIPGDKVAIELTESQNDSDFLLMKRKINELKERGIKFYLDDFGTGYSNMERIMELPFDIIKFDRSLVIASGNSERSRQIVVSLADIFARMNYSVLYEGVEGESDEKMCMGMSASYLQGYKYSRPVPIRELSRYFEKDSVA